MTSAEGFFAPVPTHHAEVGTGSVPEPVEGPYTPILGVLVYVLSPDRRQVLLIHRVGRPDDQHLGKYNGLGGKVEPLEDVAAAARREVLEETGVELTALRLRGTVSWPGFGTGGEDWFGFIFVGEVDPDVTLTANHEGALTWQPLDRLLAFDLPLWEGDRYFLPLVFDEAVTQFHGVLPYSDGRPVSWAVTLL
ncbi:MAG TPA: 8-oxo-dGTP diphosphatase [Propionibacteriaceae bacterium]|nr:8-oxo-dGTP diphosphatase [Propionibacteriaceae bacterium]